MVRRRTHIQYLYTTKWNRYFYDIFHIWWYHHCNRM